MQKQNSKKKFLEKLYISLSFYFGDDDCDSLIKDYEEWFENEEMAEKSEYEISREIYTKIQKKEKSIRFH